jgi:CDP-glycerol glycerophosphotransferase
MIIGWIFIVPFSFLIPGKKGLSIVIGKEDGLFSDNVKYFFSYCLTKKSNTWFVTQNKATFKLLKSKGINKILFYPSLKSIVLLLRAEYLVVDNVKWISNFKYYLLQRAVKIQLWHGIGSKRIALDNPRIKHAKFKSILIAKGFLMGSIPYYDYIISTSEYYQKNLYKDAFKYGEILNLGQPRNDIFFRSINEIDMLNVDRSVYEEILKRKNEGATIIVYTPTFRDTGGNLLTDKVLNFEKLDEFCGDNNIFLIIKQHPFASDFELSNCNHIILYNKQMDLYPVMSISDLMITDYSSIYLDFVLMDKPIVFFIYDYKKYTKVDRSLRNDFLAITPGPKCYSQNELELEIVNFINEVDSYKTERKSVVELSYKNIDGNSSERIFSLIK